jgi:hypothetical protein
MMIHCRRCGTVLTVDLAELKDASRLCEDDGAGHVPRGRYCLSDGEFYSGTEGDIAVNLLDVVNLKNHPDPGRLNGCCGLDGGDGLNKICPNGHAVATEKSDCWMPHAMLFSPDRVAMR